MIKRAFQIIFISIVVSFYLFPIGFVFLPATINTKMILALIGGVIFIVTSVKERTLQVKKDMLMPIGLAFLFSLACFLSVTLNSTQDYSYATYFLTFFTWLGGAYAVIKTIESVEPSSAPILIKYLTIVCLAQCVLAIMIDRIPSFQLLVDSIVVQGQEFYQEVGRLYGIGASLDTAGVRFSVVLLLISYELIRIVKREDKLQYGYLVAFLIISLIGNMISRTTTVGTVLGLAYIFASSMRFSASIKRSSVKYIMTVFGVILLFVIASVYLYRTDATFRDQIRYAFEGFFNWAETGVWRTDSTDKLNAIMWIWPTTAKSWIWGTGLFDNWVYSTDIGYCRLVLYCGLCGFSIFTLFFLINAIVVAKRYPTMKLLMAIFFGLTLVVWIKVATDIFFIYALLYCLGERDSENENHLLYSSNI